MKLELDQIIERWQAFTLHAKRIQELKDLLLDLSTISSDPEELELNEKMVKEVSEEIDYIYQECMLPILKDLMEHISANKDEIAAALQGEDSSGVMEELEFFLEDMENDMGFVDDVPTGVDVAYKPGDLDEDGRIII